MTMLNNIILFTCAMASGSLCDKYTSALLVNNTAVNQQTLLTLLVNTVVIGNYTQPNTGVLVPGILAERDNVNLLKYFTGELNTTNVDGVASQVNFLDGGGAAPLLLNKPANDTTSRQYFLLTHLYEMFGTLLGCSLYGTGYDGDMSMYETHKFMKLTHYEVDYFIGQVGLAAKSFGVSNEDISSVANSLDTVFNQRCSKPTVISNNIYGLQSMCNGEDCPLSADNVCNAYSTDPADMSNSVQAKLSGVFFVFMFFL